MNLLGKVAIVVVVVVAFLVVAYLIVILGFWQELKYARHKCRECERELERLGFAHESIAQAVELAKDNIAKCVGEEVRFHHRRLDDMQAALEKNEQKTDDAKKQLEMYQSEIVMREKELRDLKTLAWLKKR